MPNSSSKQEQEEIRTKVKRTASGFNIKQLHGAADHGLLAMGHGGRDTGR
jgi:hypothetical protein